MLIKDIYNFLDQLSPFSTQEKWDNSGLIVGSMKDSFEEVYISLDLDKQFLKTVKKGSLVITHHPLIFSGLKKINDDSYSTKLLKILIKKDIKLISMHTNIDKSHLNRYVMEKVLGFNCEVGEDFILTAVVNMSFKDLKKLVKEKLNLEYSKSVKCHKFIKNISLTTGSGMSLINDIKTDCFLTGDVKYHDAMEAKLQEISIIDIGHYESEKHFSPMVNDLLEKYLKKNKIQAIMGLNKNPFEYK
ncbi:MAG: Nif3-like dinuclear metal center hexameric protein [Arcobacteraceae bacterium]|nr:Nif3-like dinuclear metal center hexameric protein [Arcobacteraceae bacterium]